MSIHDEVDARCKEGRLVRLSGLLPGRPEVRAAFVAPAIWNLLFQGPWKGGADEEDRWIKVTAWFAWFIEGGTLVLPREERHHRGAHMLRLRREVRQPPPKEGGRPALPTRIRASDSSGGLPDGIALSHSPHMTALSWATRIRTGPRERLGGPQDKRAKPIGSTYSARTPH
jgi:hypothetical protein